MTIAQQLQAVREGVRAELTAANRDLAQVGLSWSEPAYAIAGIEVPDDEAARVLADPSKSRLPPELLVTFYWRENIVDLFEFEVIEDGELINTVDEFCAWTRAELALVLATQRRRLNGEDV